MIRLRHIVTLLRLSLAILAGSVLAIPTLAAATHVATTTQSVLAMAPAGTLTYDVMREGDRIGTHIVSFERMGEELTVRTETNVEFTAYVVFDIDWTHQAVEVWEDGGLKEFTSFTNEDGRKRQVHAKRNGDRLIVESTGGHREFPADLIPGTLWHPDTVRQQRILDPIKGRLRQVKVTDRGTETVEVEGRRIEARHYEMRGDLKRDFWYDQEGTVIKVEFPISDGSEVTLLLR
jgi:hypothetical protein